MKTHNDYMTVQTKQKREWMNITQNVRSAVEKSGIREGVVLVHALHSNAAIAVNDEEAGLWQDVDAWLERLAPQRSDYQHGARFESNAAIHLQSMLLNSQAMVGISEGKLELGPWQNVLYVELDGQRPKRILIKVMGE